MIKTIAIRTIVAGALTLLIILLIDNNFHKFEGSAEIYSEKSAHKQNVDINHDGTVENIQIGNIPNDHLYMEIWQDNNLKKVAHLDFLMVKHTPIYGDPDKDGNIDTYVLSERSDSLFLNTITYLAESDYEIETSQILLMRLKDSISPMSILNMQFVDLDQDGYQEILFGLDKGEAHRHICHFDLKSEEFKTAPTLFTMIRGWFTAVNVDEDKELEIVFSSYANGNIPETHLERAKVKFQAEQEKVFTDNVAIWGIFDHNLNPEIKYTKEGFTSTIRHKAFKFKDEFRLLTLESSLMDSLDYPTLKLFNLNGDILAQKQSPVDIDASKLSKFAPVHLKHNHDSIHPKVYLDKVNDTIFEFDMNLNISRYIHHQGFTERTTINHHDLNDDGELEIIFNVEGGFLIFQREFEEPLFLPCPGSGPLEVEPEIDLVNGENQGLIFSNGITYYLINYKENDTYFLKYIYYIGIFIGFYLLVIILQKIQTVQLEKENKKLEATVLERTAELAEKNEMLSKSLNEVEQQKSIIEEKNHEILDSISYAKRIQTAILPPPKLVKEHIDKSFILYKPKDIVAGDFYWMEPQENHVLFAAADCTGHGVPGAMVSVICNNGLNRAVREFGLTDPGEILDKTRELVIEEFEKSEEEVKDGMDIALCSLEVSSGVRQLTDVSRTHLKYAGAHNPLWIIRKGAREIEEIKADKQPIGKFGKAVPFRTNEIELQAGDTFYIFSDGFADQFGGEKGKKFKAKNFKELLLSIQDKSMEKQVSLIDAAFEKWKGNLEQLDDVCIIGVRV
jgi:serine phosphatase RsbU (regulator of sigma subunit)